MYPKQQAIETLSNLCNATATKYGNLYYLNCVGSSVYVAEHQVVIKYGSSGEMKESVWHRRFGHFGTSNLE